MTYTLFITLEIVISILLILVVLMQASKGGGLAGTLGSANIGTVFGVRRTSDFLSKTTTVLATLFILLALVINLTVLPRGEDKQSIIQQGSTVPPPATQVPTQPQPTQTQPK